MAKSLTAPARAIRRPGPCPDHTARDSRSGPAFLAHRRASLWAKFGQRRSARSQALTAAAFRRSKRIKHHRVQQAKNGPKVTLGPHWGDDAKPCLKHDRGQKAKCNCGKARNRSPNGVNKREQERNAQRERKAAAKAEPARSLAETKTTMPAPALAPAPAPTPAARWEVIGTGFMARLAAGQPVRYPADQEPRLFDVRVWHDLHPAAWRRLFIGSEVRFSGYGGAPVEPVVHVIGHVNYDDSRDLHFPLELIASGDATYVPTLEMKVTG